MSLKPNPSRLPWDCIVCQEGRWNISLWADWNAVRANLCDQHLKEHLDPLPGITVEAIEAALEKGRKNVKAFRETNRPGRGKRY